MNAKFLCTWCILSLAWQFAQADVADSVFFTTGFKIGEVTDTSAIIWTRLCAQAKPVPVTHKRKEPPFQSPLGFTNRTPVAEMDGAVKGAAGQVKIVLTGPLDSVVVDWQEVDPDRDFTLKQRIDGLQPGTRYQVRLEGRSAEGGVVSTISGAFRSMPAADQAAPVSFTSSTCQYFWDFDDPVRGFKIYDSMLALNPDFHCQTGDYVYYDKPGPMAYSIPLARHKWNAINAWPSLVDFYARAPLYLQKDDHDLLKDDAYPGISPWGQLTFADGLKIWREQAPLEGKPYRTFRWGKDLQIWLMEVREFRSKNTDPNSLTKTIWGQEQKLWFANTIQTSDATFKIVISPTPILGPDRDNGKNDNHSNQAFLFEGEWLRQFLAQQKNTFVVNGDRHWQYVSHHPGTGLWEFSQGPSSDAHAQGWDEQDVRPEHEFLRVKGGFLEVKVYRENDLPKIAFVHYDVDGVEVHRKEFQVE